MLMKIIMRIMMIVLIMIMILFLNQVIWYHDDRPVKESADFQLLFQGDRCSLLIHEAFLDDSGLYKVVAINSSGEASSECSLSISREFIFISSASKFFSNIQLKEEGP